MTIARIYVPHEMEPGDPCVLTGENRQYVLTVLRMRKGERLLLFDGKGHEYEAIIQAQDRENVILEIVSKEIIDTGAVPITLAQCLPKGWKMDFIVEKACELGAARIIPFFSERSVPQLTPGQAVLKQLRWQKVALEAARKSHAGGIPEVENVMTFRDMLGKADQQSVKIIFWEEETRMHLKQVLKERESEQNREFFLVVGPEGGFTREEVMEAEGRGFTSASLGRQVLKVETAALAILAIIQYERGSFGPNGQREGRL